ncbi:hypothetical protein CYMTET_9878 [Cymbomonas tetramitiformis]|uniref:Uncharacterized protein n=1 Tax=Cymbomonas tetramitiformis TaxID=36881 RepID=A0AAE0LEE1_9CHLO|nr:hypothetical protein CYMTET_9878 [Cymbomonas tetramitiformis]
MQDCVVQAGCGGTAAGWHTEAPPGAGLHEGPIRAHHARRGYGAHAEGGKASRAPEECHRMRVTAEGSLDQQQTGTGLRHKQKAAHKDVAVEVKLIRTGQHQCTWAVPPPHIY